MTQSRPVLTRLLGCLGAFVALSASAQDPCDPPAPSLAVGHVGGAAGEMVQVDVVGGVTDPVSGFSLAVGHDVSAVQFVSATPGTFIVAHAGNDLNFQSIEQNAEGYTAIFALFDISFPITVLPTPIDPPQVLATLVYEILPTAPPGVVPLLNRTREYGSPNPISNIYSGPPGQPPIDPVLCDGSITVELVPSVSCPADVTLQCPADTNPTTTGQATGSGSCGEVTVTSSDVNVPGCASGTATITRTWTATDACGTTSCDQTISVVDTTAPDISCPADVTLTCPADTNPTTTGQATGSDTCGSVGITFSDDVGPGVGGAVITTRTWTAVDDCGNTTSCTQVITVVDTTPPEALCRSTTVNLNASGQATITAANVDNGSNDLCSAVTLVVSQTEFSCSDLGSNVVTLTVTDDAGNTANCSQSVTVADETPPVITAPAAITLSAGSSCVFSGGAAALGQANASDNCPVGLVVTNDAPASLALGTTIVTWTATDGGGNTGNATQLVTVADATGPALTCPASITRAANQGSAFVPPDGLGDPVVSDNCSASSALTLTDNATATFPLGATAVTYTATDAAGNSTSCVQTVTVVPATAPEVTCPVGLVVETNAACTWIGELGTPTVTDVGSPIEDVVVTNDAPGAFALGITTVTWTATDPSGNASTCTQDVMVLDLTPPALSCPAGVSASCEGSEGTAVDFATSATDNCGAVIEIVCIPPSGSTFPPGSTPVTCTATDVSGNTEACSFDVVVLCAAGLVVPGDCNRDGRVDISDAICILTNLFFSSSGRETLPCGDGTVRDAANIDLMSWNGKQDLDLSDPIAILNWKFLGGPPHILGKLCVPINGCPTVCEVGLEDP